MTSEMHFDQNGNLPPGLHLMGWQECVSRFGGNDRRESLLAGMLSALHHFQDIGCRRVYIDGSFVTAKAVPGDYDGCGERTGMDLRRLDVVLRDFSPGRQAQKTAYGGEWFPATATADSAGQTFPKFFQTDRSGNRKGIVAIDLGEVS